LKKTLVNVVKFGISIGLGVLLVWLAVRKLSSNDINEMREAFSRSNWFWLIIGPAIGMASNLVRAERWNMLLRSIGYRAKFWNVAAAVYVMYIGNLAFPRLGEISRCGIVYTTDGIPVEKSIGTMVVERLVDVVTMLAVGVILFFLQYELLQAFFNQYLIDPIKSKLNIGDGSMLIKLGLMVIPCHCFWCCFSESEEFQSRKNHSGKSDGSIVWYQFDSNSGEPIVVCVLFDFNLGDVLCNAVL
jgi:hypothetical protein